MSTRTGHDPEGGFGQMIIAFIVLVVVIAAILYFVAVNL